MGKTMETPEVAIATHPAVRTQAVPTIQEAADAVIAFVQKRLGSGRGSITKLRVSDLDTEIWEAEVEVCVPSHRTKSLGLSDRKAVLDYRAYLMRLDAGLNVVAYQLRSLTPQAPDET